MTGGERDQARENWYKWFYGSQCPMLRDDACPIVQEQGRHARLSGLRFLPEAIWGNPSNPVWFIGTNPGQVNRRRPEADADAERIACMNTASPDRSYAEYVRRLRWNRKPETESEHYVLNDYVAKASLALLAGQSESISADNVPDVAIRGLTILNMAHCKSPCYGRLCDGKKRVFKRDSERQFWRHCGLHNLMAFTLWLPKLVVCFGGAPYWWLKDVRNGCSPSDGWKIHMTGDGKELRFALTRADEGQECTIQVLTFQHPSPPNHRKFEEKLAREYTRVMRDTMKTVGLPYPQGAAASWSGAH